MPIAPLLPQKPAASSLASTAIHPNTARAMAMAFLLLLGGIPLAQAVREASAGQPVQALDLWRDPPGLRDFDLTGDKNPLKTFEAALANASAPRRWVQPHIQDLLTAGLRSGNAKVVLGSDDWLFARSTLEYVSGPGIFLGAPEEGSSGEVAPLPAIARLQADCQAAGVRLILLPIPEKNQLYPEHAARSAPYQPLQNPDFDRFVAAVQALGVEVFDPLPVLQATSGHLLSYLPRDTHWAPAGMESVAQGLAEKLRPGGPYLPAHSWHTRPHPQVDFGDLVHNLGLPADQTRFPPMTVTVDEVLAADDRPWSSDPEAQVLLIGDSYTNIFTQGAMGWGESGGLAPHLAMDLGTGVDAVAVNAGAASDCRRQLAARPDPLGGKKVLIWEFAERDLTQSNWEVLPLRSRPHPAATAAGGSALLEVEAELLTRPSLPPPDTLYDNARVILKYRVRRVLAGTYPRPEMLVEMPILSKQLPQPAARYRLGSVQRLTLDPKVPADWDGQPVVDDTDVYDLTPYWAIKVQPLP